MKDSKTLWTRRRFLRTLGIGAGSALVGPLALDLMSQAEASTHPRRFVFVLEGNGIEPVTMLSSATRARIDALASQPIDETRIFYNTYGHDDPIVEPNSNLADARSLGALGATDGVESIEDRAAVVLGLSSKITGGGHSTNFGALSCTRSTSSVPARATIETDLARLADIRGAAPLDALRVGIGGRLMYSTCAFDRGKPAPIMGDPTVAFNAVFGSVAGAEGQRVFRKRSQMLDYAMRDAQRVLGGFTGSSQEAAKIETYLESVELLIARQERLREMESVLQGVKPAGPETSALYASQAPLERLEAQFEIVTAALQGALTNVAVIASGTAGSFGSLVYSSVDGAHADMPHRHDVCHFSEGNPVYREILHNVTARHVACVAKMARALDSVEEEGGTMLDNTIIVFMSDNGERHHSRAEEWPMLLVGGRNLGFLTDGRSVVYPRYGHANNRQVSNLFNSVGYAAGQPWDEFGGETLTRIARGPLAELWNPQGGQ